MTGTSSSDRIRALIGLAVVRALSRDELERRIAAGVEAGQVIDLRPFLLGAGRP